MNSSKEVIKLIKELRTRKKITLDTLSEKVGMAKSSLSRYESGERDFPINDVGKFAKALGTTVEYLLGFEGKRESHGFEYSHYPTAAISAGLPHEVEGITESSKMKLPDSLLGKYAGHDDVFVTNISGDSMDNVMDDGSVIAVKPIELDNLKDGDIVIYSNCHEYGVKHFYRDGSKLIFKPNSKNSKHYDQSYDIKENIIIHGKVIMWVTTVD